MAHFSPRGYKNPATVGEINDPAFWQTVGENQDARFLEAREAADLVSGEAAAATAKAAEAKAVADFAGQRAAGAVATAIDARDTAQAAVDTAGRLDTDVTLLKERDQLAPGQVVDQETALVLNDPNSESNTALKAQSADITDARVPFTQGYGLSPFHPMFGAKGDGATDDGLALKAYFEYVSVNDVGVANVAGNFVSSVPLVVADAKTLTFSGKCTIRFTGSGIAGVTITGSGRYGYWEYLEVNGTSGPIADYSYRTWAAGLVVSHGASKWRFGTVIGRHFSFAGVSCYGGNMSMAHFGTIQAERCGSGMRGGSGGSGVPYGLGTTWSNPVNSGGSGSTTQTTLINVGTMLPGYVLDGTFGAVGSSPFMLRVVDTTGKRTLHHIKSADAENGTLTIYPWVDPARVPALSDYVYGGAFYALGSDSNVHSYDKINASNCGVGLSAGSLYLPQGITLITQACGVGLLMGQSTTAAGLGGHIGGAYFETNAEDVVFLNQPHTSNVYNYIGADYETDLSKWHVASAPKVAGTFADSPTRISLGNTRFTHKGVVHQPEKHPYNGWHGLSAHTFAINRADMVVPIVKNAPTITGSLDEHLHRLTGYDTAQVLVMGTGAASQPTGIITFPPPAGYTINGGATAVTFSGLTEPGRFIYMFDVATKNVTVARI